MKIDGFCEDCDIEVSDVACCALLYCLFYGHARNIVRIQGNSVLLFFAIYEGQTNLMLRGITH